jgi:hypothetical protein
MSSVVRSPSTVNQGVAYLINVGTVANGTNTFDSTGATVTVVGLAASSAAGTLVVRDLGKTVRVPATSNGSSTNQRLLRKVQRVDGGAATDATWPVTNGFVGFNEGVGGSTSDYASFYIELGGVGDTLPKFARL